MGLFDDDSESSCGSDNDSSVSLGDLSSLSSSDDNSGNKNRKESSTPSSPKKFCASVTAGSLDDRLSAIANLKKEIGFKDNSAGMDGRRKVQRHKSLQITKRDDQEDQARVLPQRNASFNSKLGELPAGALVQEQIQYEEHTISDMMAKIREKHRKSISQQGPHCAKTLNLSSSSGLSSSGITCSTAADEMDELMRLKQKKEAKRNKLRKKASQKNVTEDKATTKTKAATAPAADKLKKKAPQKHLQEEKTRNTSDAPARRVSKVLQQMPENEMDELMLLKQKKQAKRDKLKKRASQRQVKAAA